MECVSGIRRQPQCRVTWACGNVKFDYLISLLLRTSRLHLPIMFTLTVPSNIQVSYFALLCVLVF